jgi:hypothetical protein
METHLKSPFSKGGFRGIINAFLFRPSLFQSSQEYVLNLREGWRRPGCGRGAQAAGKPGHGPPANGVEQKNHWFQQKTFSFLP